MTRPSLFMFLYSAEVKKTGGAGQYLSLDGRPVTAERGTMRELIKLYKLYLQNAVSKQSDGSVPSKPFLCLHVRCPPGSYDVNIEPAKDEVLFNDKKEFLNMAEQLFKNVYGELRASENGWRETPQRTSTATNQTSFDILLARKPDAPPSFETHHSDDLNGSEQHQLARLPQAQRSGSSTSADLLKHNLECNGDMETETVYDITPAIGTRDGMDTSQSKSKHHSNMFSIDDEDLPEEITATMSDELSAMEDEGDMRSGSYLNPWTIAKVNAPVPLRRSDAGDYPRDYPLTPGMRSTSAAVIPSLTTTTTHRSPLGLTNQLPTPSRSPQTYTPYQNPGPPLRPWRSRVRSEDDDDSADPDSAPPQSHGSGGPTGLDAWVKPTRATVELPSFQRATDVYKKGERFGNPDAEQSSCVDKRQATGFALNSLPANRPFKSPLKPVGSGPPNSPTMAAGRNGFPGIQPPSDSILSMAVEPEAKLTAVANMSQRQMKLSQSQNVELDEILEFEHRKKVAIAQQRKAFAKKRLDPERLASIQQLSESEPSTSENQHSGAIASSEVVRRITNPSGEDFAARFGGNSTTPPQQTVHSDPHRNRYIAAVWNLSHGHPEGGSEVDNDGRGEQLIQSATDTDGLSPDLPAKISDDDPRAYLIKHRHVDQLDKPGLIRTGLKLRRTKTNRLPLETISSNVATYTLEAELRPQTWSIETVQAAVVSLQPVDKYTRNGENDFVTLTAFPKQVEHWEEILKGLVRAEYRAKVGENELIVPDLELSLSRAIKAHADSLS